MFDDNMQYQVISDNNQIIEESNKRITDALKVIEKNKRYKSILYTTGEELVQVVLEILEEMLGCNLKDFVDEKKEDFMFEIDGHVFLGEIKGVKHNIKNENVSQLDVHYQTYLDDYPEKDGEVSAILIMNHQRNKPIEQREPVHESQIRLANRNGSLIISTPILLKLFEGYVNGTYTREQCMDLLKGKGLLEL